MKAIAILFLMWFYSTTIEPPTGIYIVREMIKAINNTPNMTFYLKEYERKNGKMKIGEEAVKLCLDPLKLYIKVCAPVKGVEVLWVAGQNNNKAYVHPNGFPYITVSLDPLGETMVSGHHTIFELSFKFISEIVSNNISKKGAENHIAYKGDVIFDGKKCYKIVIEDKNFRYITYTIQENENIKTMAKKNFLSEYLILQNNPTIKNYKDVIPGQKILVPSSYALETILYVDQISKLPLVQIINDDKGLLEKYEYYDMNSKPNFTEMDFSEDNSNYNF
jgi:hypothetical protein